MKKCDRAIRRGKLSAPVRYLHENGYLVGSILDYGCGYGKDADIIGMDKYDHKYFPGKIEGYYDTIVCNYVLCQLDDEYSRRNVLHSIAYILKSNGVAYISVRRDIDNIIELDLPIVYEKKGRYIIYKMENHDPTDYIPSKDYYTYRSEVVGI